MSVRVRMAPSPTGEYHIGHIRTVLYNWAYARKNKGQFVIRIEDTDRERYVPGAMERILEVIKMYGLDWDEGPLKEGPYGPYIQSERLDIYKGYAQKLLDSGHAYYCFCTKDRLDKLREEQRAKGFPSTRYDKHCLHLTEEEVNEKLKSGAPYVIRLNVPVDEEISFKDEVYGEITINSSEVDDQVLIKSDGYPTYHMAVVVDDHLMEITHVMRGMDWIPSTPKHILLYRAFGWEPPTYVHLPNIKELGGNKKLSKRFGSVYAVDFLKEGYLPEALLNFLMFLGWNPGTEKEIYNLDEFTKDFELEKIHKTDLVAFDRKKLLWMNGQYIRDLSVEDLWQRLKEWSTRFSINLELNNASEDYVIKVLKLTRERMKLLTDFVEQTGYFFNTPSFDDDLLFKYSGNRDRAVEILESYLKLYRSMDTWELEKVDEVSHQALEEFDYSPKEAFMTLRVVLSGTNATPPLFDMMSLLGKEICLERMESAYKLLK